MKKIIFLLSFCMSHLSFAATNSISENPMRVLIVGAGLSGLSIAKALQNRGIYPDIIEKEDEIRSDGAGIAIPANGSWALNKLGIDLASKALLVREMQFTDDQGELLIQEGIDTIHPEGSQFYSLGRNQLIQQMLSSLDKKIEIQKSTTINDFFEENDQVRVKFSNGQVKYYDLVIGCDGVHSRLRKQIHADESPEFLGLLVWRTVIDATPNLTLPTYMLGKDRAILLYPMPDKKMYVYGHVFQPIKNPPVDTFSHEFSSFKGAMSEVLDYFESQDDADKDIKFYIHHMEKSHSVRFKLDGFKRVLLVGDASHAFGPMLQNGAAQAFEDAYVLQDMLDDKVTIEQIPAFIDAFEKRRSPRVQSIFNMSNIKIQAISDPQQLQGRNEAIRKSGAPNVNGFKFIMKQNP